MTVVQISILAVFVVCGWQEMEAPSSHAEGADAMHVSPNVKLAIVPVTMEEHCGAVIAPGVHATVIALLAPIAVPPPI